MGDSKKFKQELLKTLTKGESKIISFRINHDAFAKLSRYAEGKKDDLGNPLNPSMAARRIFMAALDELSNKKK